MRKLIVSMNVTLDGFMAGPNCELDWHFKLWDVEMMETLSEQLFAADTILLGRVTYNAMARFWPMKAKDLSGTKADIAFAEMMNKYTKIVVSKTLQEATWGNSKLIKNNLVKEVTKLKNEEGRDVIIFGSGKLSSALIKASLVDEYSIWVHPVILGKGKPFFRKMQESLNIELAATQIFKSGVVILNYRNY